MNWITNRIKEHSTHQGVIAVAVAAALSGEVTLLDIVWGSHLGHHEHRS